MNAVRLCLALLLVPWLLVACADLKVEPFPKPIRPPKALPASVPPSEEGTPPPHEESREALRTIRTPGVVIQRTVAEGVADRLGEDLEGDPIRVSFHEVPLVPFINEVFGEELGMSFVISPDLRDKTDLVTLKLTEPLPPRQLFATVRRVLREYGVDLTEVEEGILTFVPSQEIASRDVPLLISGRALPEVPATHRIIFQLVPLKVVRGPQVRGVLQDAFDDRDLKILEDPDRNALLLKGRMDMVAQALAMVEVLDQPLLRGRHSTIIEPVFLEAVELAGALNTILHAEGYGSSLGGGAGGSLILLALESVDRLVVFAADQSTLEHVKAWAQTLDARRKDAIEEAVFTYKVQNTQAEELTDTLNQMLGTVLTPEPQASDEGSPSTGQAQAGDRIVVDKNRNMLLFRGTGKAWAEIRRVIEKLDKSVPSVLIEVVIAEITLTDEEKTGFEFLVRGALGSLGLTGGTIPGLDVGTQGLSFTLDSSGETRALLDLFYKSDKVVIRSRPRLLVKSGETANIEVGNEIPVITQISDEARQVGGSTNVLQDISYRKTGVQLEIKPIVQANGLVDLQISQQLSEARPTAATNLPGSPTILNRQISTSLTLRDGGALLMGGLISGNQSAGQSGVPYLARLPLFGRLFRSDAFQEDRTELVVMVIPYVIADHEEGWEITRRIREQLELHTELSQ